MAMIEDAKKCAKFITTYFLTNHGTLATSQNCHEKGKCNLKKCQRSYSQQGQGDTDTGVQAEICSSGILHTVLVTRGQGGWIQAAWGAEKTARIFSEWERWDNVGIFPYYLPFLVASVTFPTAGSCSPGKAGCWLWGLGHSSPVAASLIHSLFFHSCHREVL